MDLTPDQIAKLTNLGITVPPTSNTPTTPNVAPSPAPEAPPELASVRADRCVRPSPETLSNPTQTDINNSIPDQNTTTNAQSLGNSDNSPSISTPKEPLLTTKATVIPLLSISGLTLLSLGGLILLKTKDSSLPAEVPSSVRDAGGPSISNPNSSSDISPTQVPKSIQHYLLTSQQYFTQALQSQQSSSSDTVNLLNQSLLAATDAIKSFPGDYRGFQQRGKIYLTLIDSQPQIIDQAIADLSTAYTLNPSSAETTRDLASLYARKGDANNTIGFLARTVAIEPTKAQNFYDLAKLQQQAGQIADAVQTLTQLSTIISDPTQQAQIDSEKKSLESLLAQSNTCTGGPACPPSPSISKPALPSPSTSNPTINLQSPLIQADSGTGLIIAAPETSKNISVANQTDSNALSGSATLVAGTPSTTIQNTNINSTSQVYLTLTKGGKNQTLKVLSKSAGSFVAGFDTPLNETVEFKYWIIN